ncbi:flagellar hook-basal body protein [Vibrio cincinnatiensis]|uniref:flagellar hook-basal body protein n=1 Tax=Vibrio cincinnatiensis TaxID=675 RepID=UPI001EDCAE5A|nr:flagellar hook basal-body protein [Vibrio cincinnatiensis]MCG3723688.1 flagellar hook basal-body protein [Vibrio cincinnatiensis]
MVDPIDIVSRSMREDLRRLDVISNNVANVNSIGFKAQALDGGDNGTIHLDNGSLFHTGRSMDLAIQGSGYFVVDNQGEKLLSRNGSFTINSEGYLVTSAGGYLVQGSSGALYVGDEAIDVSPNGQILVGGQDYGSLLIHKPSGEIRPAGNGTYRVETSDQIQDGYSIFQGSLEASNVEVASEMMQLMETQKHFGLVQRYFVTYDGLLKDGINQIGKDN